MTLVRSMSCQVAVFAGFGSCPFPVIPGGIPPKARIHSFSITAPAQEADPPLAH
jgi:hypothetical protein